VFRVISVRSAALTLLALIVTGCAPSVSSPTPTVASSPTATTSPAVTPSGPARIQVRDEPLPGVAGAFLLFQLPGETRFRAISFGAELNGFLPDPVRADAVWSQSPYGDRYAIGTTVYHRDGVVLGALPWDVRTVTWSSEGRFVCAAVPERATAGAAMRLETALIGQPTKLIATGYATYSDNATYRVLACDEGADRAIVAVFGQGVAAARLWVFRLSTGAIVRSVDYGGTGGWVAASGDGSTLAESVPPTGGATIWKTTIRSADDGAQLGTIDDFVARGFSGDKALVVGNTPNAAAIVEWKSGRKVWSASGPYGGFLPDPAGRRLAVGVGFVGGSDQRDVYLVQPNGSALLLPARVRVSLLY
jgi:hypothetical protein